MAGPKGLGRDDLRAALVEGEWVPIGQVRSSLRGVIPPEAAIREYNHHRSRAVRRRGTEEDYVPREVDLRTQIEFGSKQIISKTIHGMKAGGMIEVEFDDKGRYSRVRLLGSRESATP